MQRFLAVFLILAAITCAGVTVPAYAQDAPPAETSASMDEDSMMPPEDAEPASGAEAEEAEELVEDTALEFLGVEGMEDEEGGIEPAPEGVVTPGGEDAAPDIESYKDEAAEMAEEATEEDLVTVETEGEEDAVATEADPCVAILENPESGLDARIDCVVKPVADMLLGFVFTPMDAVIPDSMITASPEGSKTKTFSEQIAGVPIILLWLVVAAVFFTFYLNFVNLRMFGHAWKLVFGTEDKHAKGEGEISNFEALATSLAGTVGLGNIAGVAVAISVGGPGAMVWMMIMGFFGMSAKFAECALGVKYRHINPEGHMSGGPMYFLKEGFGRRGKVMGVIGLFLGFVFAVCCVGGSLGGGNMFQANQAFQQFLNVTGGEASFLYGKGWMFGIVLALMVAAVIIGGIRSIAHVSSAIVPLMAIVYLGTGVVIVGMHIEHVPEAFSEIFRAAFFPDGDQKALYGGILGALIQGVRRAAFSNEAGIGSASIAHAAVKTDRHMTQGFVAMLGPFIDTIVICTMTALVIVISGVHHDSVGMEGVALTSRAFESVFSWFPYILAFAVFLFAFSTMIAWSYYGLKCFTYIFGESRLSEMTFKVIFCLFVVVGAAANLENVIGFTDGMIFAMAVPNILGLYFLSHELKADLKAYVAEWKAGK